MLRPGRLLATLVGEPAPWLLLGPASWHLNCIVLILQDTIDNGRTGTTAATTGTAATATAAR